MSVNPTGNTSSEKTDNIQGNDTTKSDSTNNQYQSAVLKEIVAMGAFLAKLKTNNDNLGLPQPILESQLEAWSLLGQYRMAIDKGQTDVADKIGEQLKQLEANPFINDVKYGDLSKTIKAAITAYEGSDTSKPTNDQSIFDKTFRDNTNPPNKPANDMGDLILDWLSTNAASLCTIFNTMPEYDDEPISKQQIFDMGNLALLFVSIIDLRSLHYASGIDKLIFGNINSVFVNGNFWNILASYCFVKSGGDKDKAKSLFDTITSSFPTPQTGAKAIKTPHYKEFMDNLDNYKKQFPQDPNDPTFKSNTLWGMKQLESAIYDFINPNI